MGIEKMVKASKWRSLEIGSILEANTSWSHYLVTSGMKFYSINNKLRYKPCTSHLSNLTDVEQVIVAPCMRFTSNEKYSSEIAEIEHFKSL